MRRGIAGTANQGDDREASKEMIMKHLLAIVLLAGNVARFP
jgi:hypothetical protein